MAARELPLGSPEQIEARFPKLDAGKIAGLAAFGQHPGYRADRSSPSDLYTGLRVHCARCAGGQTAGGSLDPGELSLGSTRGPDGASFQRCPAVQEEVWAESSS